jgi:mono/diheme cytochrome c family protein
MPPAHPTEGEFMRTVLTALGFVLTATAALAQAPRELPGDPANGRAIASRGCAQCHVISENQGRSAADGVPTFGALARDPSMTLQRLQGFMQAPHPPMPDLALSRREIDDIASYILSLRQR